MSGPKVGHTVSRETRDKISKTLKARRTTPVLTDAERASQWNKTHPEARKVIRDRWQEKNRDIQLVANRLYRSTPEAKAVANAYRLKRAFGITVTEYNQMYSDQDGKCAICHQPETRLVNGQPTQIGVDHNHQTKKVRKLLCHACNVSVGLLKENTTTMLNMVAYLESFA